jgi:flagella basal body P-ring formation protein FlgA
MIRFFIFVFSVIFLQHAYANVTGDSIQQLAKHFVLSNLSLPIENLHVDVLALPDDLNLPDCPATNISYQNPGSQDVLGQRTLSISCEKPYWHLYVQVNICGKVPVVVSSRAILQNETLDASDLTINDMDSKNLSQPYFTSLDGMAGTRARSYIPAMAVIKPSMVQKQFIIKSGSPVGIVLDSGSVYVRMSGVAVDDGMKGDLIRVRNATSGRIITAKVVNSMIVKVDE